MVPIIINTWPVGVVAHWLCMQLLTSVSFEMIVGDPYSVSGATLLGLRVLIICSAVMMFGQEVQHFIIDSYVLCLA
jgi:hypothetical protein